MARNQPSDGPTLRVVLTQTVDALRVTARKNRSHCLFQLHRPSLSAFTLLGDRKIIWPYKFRKRNLMDVL